VGTAGTNHSESCFFGGYSKSVTGAFAGADTDVSVAQARRWACVSGVLCLQREWAPSLLCAAFPF
jgi:hypothetical protein